jgi:hypothetical protein
VSISTRRKLASILLSVAIFATLAGLASRANGRPGIFAILSAIFVGTAVGFFEEFYVQSLRGRWIRNIHPLTAILIYTVIVVVFFLIAIHLSHLLLWPFYELSVPYRRLPFVIPVVIAFSVVGIVVMRTVHFIGIETLFHLTIGTYHRPVIQEKVLVFLDINDSTRLAEELGPVRTKSLVGKFLFDISKPITDHGGEIYLYKGDGLIALWDWREAIRDNRILRVIDAIFATIGREQGVFWSNLASCHPSGSGAMAARSWSASKAIRSGPSASMAAQSISRPGWRRRQRCTTFPASSPAMSLKRSASGTDGCCRSDTKK